MLIEKEGSNILIMKNSVLENLFDFYVNILYDINTTFIHKEHVYKDTILKKRTLK